MPRPRNASPAPRHDIRDFIARDSAILPRRQHLENLCAMSSRRGRTRWVSRAGVGIEHDGDPAWWATLVRAEKSRK